MNFIFEAGGIKMPLLDFLKKQGISKNIISRLKKEGGLYVNDEKAHTNRILLLGDKISLMLDSANAKSDIMGVPMKLDIIYEDEAILAINKPPYMAAHPVRGHINDTLANGVMHYLGQQATFRLINRLDRDTSGISIIAKDPIIASYLCQKDIIKKCYLGIAKGCVPDIKIIEAPIKRLREGNIERGVSSDGQSATTLCRILEKSNDASLMEFKLLTGRTHQIRVHMKHLGFPLLGDFLYNKGDDNLIKRQALHCYKMDILLKDGSIINLKAPVPNDMKQALHSLGFKPLKELF